MRKTIYKKFPCLLLLAALLFLVPACGGPNGAKASQSAVSPVLPAPGQAADEVPPAEPDPEAMVDLSLYEEGETAGKTVLVIGTMRQDGPLESAVSRFNAASEVYTARIEIYDSTLALHTQIAAGDGPDVLLLDQLPYLRYIWQGVLADLSDVLDAQKDFIPVIRRLIQTQFSDRVCIASFSLDCVAAPESLLQGRTSWTVEAFTQLAENTNVFSKTTKEVFLNLYCLENLDRYLNFEDDTCSFESDEFCSVLALANRFLDSESEILKDGRAPDIDLTNCIVSASGLDTSFYDETFWGGSPSCFLGFPGDSESGIRIRPNLIFGVPYTAPYQGAKAFLDYLLSEEFQSRITANFPVLERAAMDRVADVFSGSAFSDTPEIIAQKQAQLQDLFDRTTAISYQDKALMDIILEEAETYFSADKTAKEAATVIQNRVGTYLAEMP